MTRADDLERLLLEKMRKSQDPPTDLFLRMESRLVRCLDTQPTSSSLSDGSPTSPAHVAIVLGLLLVMIAAFCLLL